jgi:hypothetical protein
MFYVKLSNLKKRTKMKIYLFYVNGSIIAVEGFLTDLLSVFMGFHGFLAFFFVFFYFFFVIVIIIITVIVRIVRFR